MNKGSLIDAMYNKSKASSLNFSKNELSKIFDIMLDEIVNGLVDDKIVRIVGFGTWTRVQRKARKGRNPSSGKEIIIPARIDIKFNAGKRTKDIINGLIKAD